MNLDDLKIQLNKKIEDTAVPVGEGQLAQLLKRSSQSLVSKLKHSLVLELIISIVFTLGCFVASFYDHQWSLRIYFGIFVFVGLAFSLVLFYLLNRIKQLNDQPLPVKENLKAVVRIMQEYKKHYFRFSVALMPVCIFLAFWLSYKEQPDYTLQWLQSHAVLISVLIIIVCAGIYYFNKWYLDKLYGRYIMELKNNLAELEDEH